MYYVLVVKELVELTTVFMLVYPLWILLNFI